MSDDIPKDSDERVVVLERAIADGIASVLMPDEEQIYNKAEIIAALARINRYWADAALREEQKSGMVTIFADSVGGVMQQADNYHSTIEAAKNQALDKLFDAEDEEAQQHVGEEGGVWKCTHPLHRTELCTPTQHIGNLAKMQGEG